MKSPIVSVNGNYAVVADRQGAGIYICNPDGCQGQAASLLPIMGATVSARRSGGGDGRRFFGKLCFYVPK